MKMRTLRNNHGTALPIVLMIFVVLLILGIAMLGITLSEAKQSTWQNNRVQAHYLARSGVQHGIKLFESKAGFPGSISQLTAVLNTLAGNVGTTKMEYPLITNGKYDIYFEEGTYSGEIKIVSKGIINGNWGSTQTVSYTQVIEDSFNYNDPSSAWLTGINLDKGITTSQSYINKAVMVESKKNTSSIQSPKGSSNPSTFQATIIAFRDFKNRSLRQVTNSVSVTFDAQLMFFLGDIILNSTNDPIILTVSPEVKASTNSIPKLQQLLDDFNPFGLNPDDPTEEGYGYDGIVKFGNEISGSIKNSSETELLPPTPSTNVKRYYYFKNGINLQSSIDLSTKLKAVTDPDLIKALDAFIGISPSSAPPFWDNK